MKINPHAPVGTAARIHCLSGCILILGLNLFYKNASADDLKWMLAPIAWWAGILSRISFSYRPQTGYVSNAWQFIIAPSCCGIRFMSICIASLLFSHVHRTKTRAQGFAWLALCTVISYVYTIFINGFRITLSIYLPLWFESKRLWSSRLTPQKLHTLIGTAIYFTALIALCQTVEFIIIKIKKKAEACQPSGILLPTLYYLFIVLGLPCLSCALRRNWTDFFEYAAPVAGSCLAVFLLSRLTVAAGKHLSASHAARRFKRLHFKSKRSNRPAHLLRRP